MGIKGKNLLIIEDDPVISEFYSSVLSASGVNTTVANSSIEALKVLQNQTPHLVILDMRLGDEKTSGLDLLQHMRSQNSLANIPVVIISSDCRKSTIYKALALGADDFQIKPVTAKQLIQRVRKVFVDFKVSEVSFINEFTGHFDANFVGLFKGDFEVKLEVPAQIKAINELSCLVSAPVKFEKNESVEVKAPITKEVGQEKFILRANEDGRGVQEATFSTRFSLVAVDEDTAQKLRTLRGPSK